jgi:hypothetical protein
VWGKMWLTGWAHAMVKEVGVGGSWAGGLRKLDGPQFKVARCKEQG